MRRDEEVLVPVSVHVRARHAADGLGGTEVGHLDQVVVPVGSGLGLRLQVVGATVVTARHEDPRLALLAGQKIEEDCDFSRAFDNVIVFLEIYQSIR